MRFNINQLKEMKQKGEPIAVLTAYDFPTAQAVDKAGVPVILVGDSLGMVVLGYESTIPVTMDEMIHHTKAVVRGSQKALVIGDMPFMSYHLSADDALRNAARFIQEGGAQAVKLEGGVVSAEKVNRIAGCGIPVMGHIGLTPQSVHQLGGYKAQGKTPETASALLKDALALEAAGAFAIVLETVPAPLAAIITQKLAIPTISCGAGIHCDGQVQVLGDLLGMSADFVPRHAKQYARLCDVMSTAITQFCEDVKSGAFPAEKQSVDMDESLLKGLKD